MIILSMMKNNISLSKQINEKEEDKINTMENCAKVSGISHKK